MYGHKRVSVIDGGLPRAVKEGVPLETGEPSSFQVRHQEYEKEADPSPPLIPYQRPQQVRSCSLKRSKS